MRFFSQSQKYQLLFFHFLQKVSHCWLYVCIENLWEKKSNLQNSQFWDKKNHLILEKKIFHWMKISYGKWWNFFFWEKNGKNFLTQFFFQFFLNFFSSVDLRLSKKKFTQWKVLGVFLFSNPEKLFKDFFGVLVLRKLELMKKSKFSFFKNQWMKRKIFFIKHIKKDIL